MAERHLTHGKHLILILLFNDFVTKLESFDMVCEVVEIESSGLLLKKLDSFDSNLCILILFFTYFLVQVISF